MRKIACWILAALAVYAAAPQAYGGNETNDPTIYPWHVTNDFVIRYWKMMGGMAVGFLAHEAAHYAAGVGMVSFDGGIPVPNWSCYKCSRGHTRFVSLAGFMEQIITTEIIFSADALPRLGPSFTHGFVAFNIALPLGYVFANEVSDTISGEGMGDLKAFNRAERRTIEVTLLTWSAWSWYRWYAIAERKRPPPSYSLLITPQYDGGIALFYATKF